MVKRFKDIHGDLFAVCMIASHRTRQMWPVHTDQQKCPVVGRGFRLFTPHAVSGFCFEGAVLLAWRPFDDR